MNKNLDYIFKVLSSKRISSYYLPLSNEHLFEFTKFKNNYLYELSGFTGDTGSIFLYNNVAYLFVDGRFTIQAKKEINDKRIKIVEINNSNDKIDFIISKLKKNKSILVNPKLLSIDKINNIKPKIKAYNISLVLNSTIFSKYFESLKKSCFNLSKAPLFILDKKYVGETPNKRISVLLNDLVCNYSNTKNIYYITSNLEEIAYLTNIRFKFCDIGDESVLFDSFMLISNKKSILYIKDYLLEKDITRLKRNKIYIKDIKDFYSDLRELKNNNNVFLDGRINNYNIYKCLPNANLINSPLYMRASIKTDTEISNLKKCNVLDGVAMVKILYSLKKGLSSADSKAYSTEYDIMKLVNKTRKSVGKKLFLCNSFETIVAYKENSAICHYIPKKGMSKKISRNSVLLIDSGGNYLTGTTDITRTISLYKNKKSIPNIIKKHYTLVLKSLIDLSMLIFPKGLTGANIDIIARKNLYDNYLDFNHGTGHGIGYISNVHEGPNTISPIIKKNYNDNVLLENQVSSNEPGLYFENKYGIRLENDILVKKIKENDYGEYMCFETLTLCPFDKDLIDKKYLDDKEITFFNEYNKLVYSKIYKYLTNDERQWLMKETSEV